MSCEEADAVPGFDFGLLVEKKEAILPWPDMVLTRAGLFVVMVVVSDADFVSVGLTFSGSCGVFFK